MDVILEKSYIKAYMKMFSLSGLFFIVCFLAVAPFLPAQTADRQSAAEEIETLLRTNAVTWAQAARFMLEASGAAVISDFNEAFNYALGRNWLPKNVSPDDAARLDGISHLSMSSFGIKGGLLYSITKSPHYAYRELVYKNTIQWRSDPAMKVSGERLLFITNRILSQRGDIDDDSLINLSQEEAQEAAQEEETTARREALAAEINVILEEHNVADTSAEATGEGVMIRLSNIRFLADSSQLVESEMAKIREIGNILKTIPGTKILVAGHTALAGSEEDRQRMSLERAQAVAAYLVSLGVRKESEITAVGYGAGQPIADNNTADGMAANRRVEITILEN